MMPVMAVNNEGQHEQAGDYRSRPRWSAGNKRMEAVLRLLRGESPRGTLRGSSRWRHIGWRPGGTTSWRAARKSLKGQRPDRSS